MEWEVQGDGKSDETVDIRNMTQSQDSIAIQVSRESAIMAGGSLSINMSGTPSQYYGNFQKLSLNQSAPPCSYKSSSTVSTSLFDSLSEMNVKKSQSDNETPKSIIVSRQRGMSVIDPVDFVQSLAACYVSE